MQDGRPLTDQANYSLGEREAVIYLACEDGATVDEVHDTLRANGWMDLSREEIREFLDDLTNARLVYAESGRYLALALPWRLPEAA